ncbi:Clavaminate synthase-like protein [Astrocystis sublimbata]|nr:Clavaminate synthase-like protein [Astrocystis sublimbata]
MSFLRLISRACVRSTPGQISRRSLSSLPNLHCNAIAEAQNAQHVRQIDSLLKERGILKISLRFEDDDCTYLKSLLLNLHRDHGHGLPITHSASRGWFWDVRPQEVAKDTSVVAARSETMENFSWHTDCSYEASPPCYFALQVIRADQCGGGTLSVLNADSLLSVLSPTVVESLCRKEFQITVPPEFVKSEHQKNITGSVLHVDKAGGRVQLRFRHDIIHASTAQGEAALKELQQALSGSIIRGHVLDLAPDVLPRGSIVLLDNRRWLHSRNHVRDPNRYLRRVRWDAQPFNTM